jgi:HSP20 family molecular chaperone IbpA
MENPTESKEMARRSAEDICYPEQIRQTVHVHPDVDILERPDELLLRADLPGVGADAIDIKLENGTLSISGKVHQQLPTGVNFIVQEFEPKDFYREFAVGEGVDAAKISAEYSDGVLTLHLPKTESAKPRKIQVAKK